MRTTDRGLLALARYEGVPAPYLDVKDVWTFGVGHTAAAGAPDPATLVRDMPADLGAGITQAFGSSAPTSSATRPTFCAPSRCRSRPTSSMRWSRSTTTPAASPERR